MKSNNVKRIVKSLLAYYEDKLQVSFSQSNIDIPDATLISKSEDEAEIMKLLSFLLALVLQCDKKAAYISRIRSLPETTQKHLMNASEQVSKKYQTTR